MMTNLFPTFDPAASTNLFLNWLSALPGLLLLPSMFWLIPSRINLVWIKITSTLHNEFKILLKTNKMMGSTLIFISLFSFILFNNFFGFFPYIFF